MQYLLLIHDDEAHWGDMPEDERNAIYGEYTKFTEDVQNAGILVGAQQRQHSGTATVVHVAARATRSTHGPVAVATLDEALEWAAKIPSARYGHIEVRPIVMRTAEVAS